MVSGIPREGQMVPLVGLEVVRDLLEIKVGLGRLCLFFWDHGVRCFPGLDFKDPVCDL